MKKITFVLGFALLFVAVTNSFGQTSKQIKLTQSELKITDPRVPDKFEKNGDMASYFFGSWAPELPEDQLSAFILDNRTTKNLKIDGKSIELPSIGHASITMLTKGRLLLPPGKHKLNFSYYEEKTNWYGTNDRDIITINCPYGQLEVDMKPGETYYLDSSVVDITNQSAKASLERYMMGYGGRYSVEIYTRSFKWKDVPNSRASVSNRKYLEPYDSSISPESQCLLETEYGIYVVGFDENTVGWGSKDSIVTISISAGKHELQLKNIDSGLLYKMNADFVAGHRYICYVKNSIPFLKDYTYGNNAYISFEINSNLTPKIHYDIASYYWDQKKYDKAAGEYEKIIEIDPKNRIPRKKAWYYSISNAAFFGVKTSKEIKIDNFSVFFNLAICYFNTASYEKALSAFRRGYEIDITNKKNNNKNLQSIYLGLMGLTLDRLGRTEEANSTYTELSKIANVTDAIGKRIGK